MIERQLQFIRYSWINEKQIISECKWHYFHNGIKNIFLLKIYYWGHFFSSQILTMHNLIFQRIFTLLAIDPVTQINGGLVLSLVFSLFLKHWFTHYSNYNFASLFKIPWLEIINFMITLRMFCTTLHASAYFPKQLSIFQVFFPTCWDDRKTYNDN